MAAVGPSTARALAARGIRADFVPSTPGARHLGAELPTLGGKTALHLTSHLAEADLQHALEARGLTYSRAELYRTEPAPLTPRAQQALLRADVVTLASGSAARFLAQVAGTAFKVAAMGPQTAEAARAAGFLHVTVAHESTLEALADAAAQAILTGS